MNRRILIFLLCLLANGLQVLAQQAQKSNLQQQAEAAGEKDNIASARYLYIRAFEDYANKGKMAQSVECGTKATALYYKENYYKEAFDLLRRIDQTIIAQEQNTASRSALHYRTAKERMQMYMKLRKPASAKDQIDAMENHAKASGDENVKNDLLYNKAIYYYTFGQNAQGNAVFKEMADKLTSTKEYDKVDEVYQTLIANGRKSGSANLVAQSYASYMAWKDSVSARKVADEIGALKKQIADGEATIADKDSSLATRQATIIGLGIVIAVLAAVLVLGAVALLRYIVLTRKLKKNLKLANESDALKAKFISNISAQLEPTLKRLDGRQPEVKAMLGFADNIQTLSSLQNTDSNAIELEETDMSPFCEGLMDQIRDKVKAGSELMVNTPKMSAKIYKPYVEYIIKHLLGNAAYFAPEGGHIKLEFKKRGAHSYQFLVSNTGSFIPEEKREDVFKPFLEVKDLTEGDGLGLPICKQMALKMKGELDIDTTFTKGTRFVLDLHA